MRHSKIKTGAWAITCSYVVNIGNYVFGCHGN